MPKEELINMWMAHGFISSSGGRLEVRGNEIFNQLVQRSIFQDVKEEMGDYDYFGMRTTCRMHDLVHDLAQSIVQNECVALLPEQAPNDTQLLKDVHHLSISSSILNIKNTLKASPNLRTILSTTGNVKYDGDIPGPTSLRVLQLPYGGLSTSMKFVRHLRYLQLCTSLIEFPESICTLLHLQTLDLSGCEDLLRLPKRLAFMISLRHLYLDHCGELTTMAPGMGRMTNLQTLTHYIVSEETRTGIGELKDLRLSSRLAVKNLELVKDAYEAGEINLQSKEDLTSLLLGWSRPRGGINNVEQMLEELKPPRFLKFLEIFGYGGSKFPTWMAYKLQLQHLVKLHLKGMDNLRYIFSHNISDDTTVQAFPSLKELVLSNLKSLKDWWKNKNAPQLEGTTNCFPTLVNLVIRECPELAGSIPMFPCLKLLKVIYSGKIPLGSVSGLTSLVSLKLKNFSEEGHGHDPLDSFLPHEIVALKHLQCLKDLRIRGSHKVPLVWRHEDDEQDEESSGHSSLEYLQLRNCDWIFSQPGYDGFWTCMASLKSMTIHKCNALLAFPYKALQGLKSLRELSIWKCKNMTDKSPAADFGSSFLPQLEELYLDGCSRLEKVPSIWGPSLKTINIGECESLVSLAASEQELGRLM